MDKPFDQRVIHHLERPTSSDLNIAQSQLNLGTRALARQMFQHSIAGNINASGSLGASFLVIKQSGTDRDVKITRGIGYLFRAFDAGTDDNIDGITGLSDPLYYRLVSMEDAGIVITVPDAPGVGLCRRDVIAIRPIKGAEGLSGEESTDIYDPSLNTFDPVSLNKTFGYDLTGATPQIINYDETPTSPVVYIKGQVSPYSEENSLLAAPIAPPAGYLTIAIINVVQNAAVVNADDIVDFRRIVAPQADLVIKGAATIGASAGNPGAALSDVNIKAPPGIKATIWKYDSGVTNSYALVVFGPRNVTQAAISFSVGAEKYYGWLLDDPTSATRPIQVISGSPALNSSTSSGFKTFATSEMVPAQAVAIGQPYHIFPFTLCTTENILVSQTEPVTSTTSGTVTLPANPQSNYLAGNYDVNYSNTFATYYLNYPLAPLPPITGLPAQTYDLGRGALFTEDSTSVNVAPGVTKRIAGFVLPDTSEWDSFYGGYWNLSVYCFTDKTAFVYIKARVYSYDGTTNPESGAYLFESDLVNVPPDTSAIKRINIVMQTLAHTKAAGSRLYVVLYANYDYPHDAADVTVYFNGNRPAILTTTIQKLPVPYVSLPNNPNPDYPAGAYPITASTSTSSVSFDIASVVQKLNPAATVFQSKLGPFSETTVPITFTAHLTLGD